MKIISTFYTGLLACLTNRALSAVVTLHSTNNLSTAIDTEGGPYINESYILNTTNPNTSNLTYPADPVWVYPEGKNLALQFYNFGPVTAAQTFHAFAVLAVVLEAARTHSEYEVLSRPETYLRGPMVVNFSPGGRLLWGNVLDTAIAVNMFFSIIPCTTHVAIHHNVEAKIFIGEFWLSASTSAVSSS